MNEIMSYVLSSLGFPGASNDCFLDLGRRSVLAIQVGPA
jgi:hypothetical protein